MKVSVSTYIGAASAGLGSFWLWTCLGKPVIRGIIEGELGAFMLILLPLSIPGWFGLVYGVKLIRRVSKTNIARAVGTFLCFVVIIGASSVSGTLEFGSDKDTTYSLSILIFSLALMPVYVWVAKAVMLRENLAPNDLRDFFGKPFILLFAFLTHGGIRDLFELIGPADYMSRPDEPFTFVAVVLPIFLAWCTYKVFIKIVGTNNQPPQIEGPAHV